MTGSNKPYAQSCDENRDPILTVLQPRLASCESVLGIGSGTGQHAVYFARKMPHLKWQPSDQAVYLPGIQQWLADAGLDNIFPPLEIEVTQQIWPNIVVDAVFSANTLHIMSWAEVERFFEKIPEHLVPGGKLLIYGPFNYDNTYTSESNAQFDIWLKQRDPLSGIRDFEAVDRLANKFGLQLREDITMPVNNRILFWEKIADNG